MRPPAAWCRRLKCRPTGSATIHSAAEPKTMQEVITLTVFATFSVLALGERITMNHIVGFALICAGALFVFRGPLPA
jgi:uncharacterized protein (DUF486 family)